MATIKNPRDEQRRIEAALRALPQPITFWEHVEHYLVVRQLNEELRNWQLLEFIGATMVGYIPKGGDETEECCS